MTEIERLTKALESEEEISRSFSRSARAFEARALAAEARAEDLVVALHDLLEVVMINPATSAISPAAVRARNLVGFPP